MKVAIIGGGNCYALNLANHLHDNGIAHFGIGRRPPKPAPFWLAPPGYEYHVADLNQHQFIIMDILDREQPEIIVNFAAQGEGAASFGAHAPDFYRTNAYGLASLVDKLRARPYLRQFIHVSTSELYGSTTQPAKESDPLRPSSPYAISKATFDQHLEVMHRIHGFPMTIVRPSNCYCPGQQLHRIIPKAIVCARAGRKLPLEGGGKARKSYLYASDLSRAIAMLIHHLDAAGKTYNIGPNARDVSILSIVQRVADVCGVNLSDLVEQVPDRVGQDARYWMDSTRITEDAEWSPMTGLTAGICVMAQWVDNYPELLTMPTDYTHVA